MPRKTATTRATKSKSKTNVSVNAKSKNVPKPKSKPVISKSLKRCYDETLEILDSDDDFVIPNPSVRGFPTLTVDTPNKSAYSDSDFDVDTSVNNLFHLETEVQESQSQLDVDGENEELLDLDVEIEEKVEKALALVEDDESDEITILESVIKAPSTSTNENGFFNKNLTRNHNHRIFGTDANANANSRIISNTRTTKTAHSSSSYNYCSESIICDNPNSSQISQDWKGLMQRMQQNEKLNSTTATTSKGSTAKKPVKLKLPKKLASPRKADNKSIRPVSTSTSGFLNLNSLSDLKRFDESERSGFFKIHESPPKKLKLEILEIMEETAIVPVPEDQPSASVSPSSLEIPTSSCNLPSNLKVPNIFLKPSERAALAKAQNSEKLAIQSDLCAALKLLSTEPETFSSSVETIDKFDGNVVKLNESSEVDQTYFNSKTKNCPFYKKLPGTKFSVDAFNYGLIPGVEVYFLSHFHSDHYIGLTKKFCKTLICSPPTANLVQMKLSVDHKCIRKLQINKEYIIDGAKVILINANHCPGSVMFIFRLPNGTTYFHTGDFRFTSDMLDSHHLQGLRIDCLYLDTTYCDPQYDFPTQSTAISEVIQIVRQKIVHKPKTLIVCGSYVIGKERVYFSLAEAIKSKVYMNYEKRRVINALENPKYDSYLTGQEDQGCIHVMQMFSIVPKFLSEYLEKRNNKYTNIIGIKPTGWQFSSSGSGSTVRSYFGDTVTIIGVPYSEHSSFSELETLVKATKPAKVQPTVNVGSTEKREKMMEHINKWLSANSSA